MSDLVLDASALIALMKDEPGAELVAGHLQGATMSTVNVSEVIAHFVKTGVPPARADESVLTQPLTIVDVDVELAKMAAHLLPVTQTAGLSLGDRVCLALGKRRRLPVMTADRQWREIAEEAGVEILVIR